MLTEAQQNATMRKRKPLRESYTEAFPEQTPVLSMMTKKSGQRTTSATSSEVEWPFKTFSPPTHETVYDGDDVDFDTEAEDNESNKDMIKGRIMLVRAAVKTGRIANAVVAQHGGVEPGTNKSIHKDHIKDALRRLRERQELAIVSCNDSKAQATVGGVKVPYRTRGLVSWGRAGAHADLPIPEMARLPAGQRLAIASASAFTEANLNSIMQTSWQTRRTMGKWKMMNTGDMQTQINQFACFGEQSETKAPIRRMNQDASKSTITLNVRVYNGSFGSVESIPTVNLPDQKVGTANTVSADATISNLSFNALKFLAPGMLVSGTGIAAGTRIAYIVSATSVELDTAATANGTGVSLTFGEVVFSEILDFDFLEFNFVEEVGWEELENKGGGPRGYTDGICFLANLNPQAHAFVMKS